LPDNDWPNAGDGHALSRDRGYTYVDPYGEALGYEDVFTKLERAIRHCQVVGLGENHARRIVR
jgi:hypothetical protein